MITFAGIVAELARTTLGWSGGVGVLIGELAVGRRSIEDALNLNRLLYSNSNVCPGSSPGCQYILIRKGE